jgi:hypothetical protein
MPQSQTLEQDTITYTQAELLAALGLPPTSTIMSVIYNYQLQQLVIVAQGPTTTTGTI